MHPISLPDPIYLEATRFATASGQSVEAYVVEAVQMRVREEAPVVLSPERAAIVRESQSDMRAGKGSSLEQVKERLAARKATWIGENQP